MLAQGTETLKESFGFAEALFFGLILKSMAKINWEIGCSDFIIRVEGIFLPRITSP